jgi:hypothetical protein
MEVVQRYTVDFTKFWKLCLRIEPTATGHLIEQIDYKTIITKELI